VTVKLNVKRSKVQEPTKRVTQCPDCGSGRIEWKMSLESLRHDYVCPACGYQGTVVLERRVNVEEDDPLEELRG
jgi:predicted RNA-binding Zn-ribbon protein involved in translation (DUF1610 family)